MSTKRWMDSESAEDDLAREVLRAGLDVGPPDGAERDVWRKVAAVVGAPMPQGVGLDTTTPAATGTVTSGGAATFGLLAKGFVLGVGASALVGLAPRVLERRAASRDLIEDTAAAPSSATAHPRGRVTASSAVSSPVKAPSSAEDRFDDASVSAAPTPSSAARAGAAAEQPSRAVRGPSSAAFPVTAEAMPRRTSLAAEAALLQKARTELRAGATSAAFATLEASRQKFSAPELDQEREALAIELLYRTGQEGPASARARAFLLRYPESPHGSRIKSFLVVP
jgi:hypothetical protein